MFLVHPFRHPIFFTSKVWRTTRHTTSAQSHPGFTPRSRAKVYRDRITVGITALVSGGLIQKQALGLSASIWDRRYELWMRATGLYPLQNRAARKANLSELAENTWHTFPSSFHHSLLCYGNPGPSYSSPVYMSAFTPDMP